MLMLLLRPLLKQQRGEQHFVAASGHLQEHAQGNQHQRAQQLVGRAEQRPDVGVTNLGQQEAEGQLRGICSTYQGTGTAYWLFGYKYYRQDTNFYWWQRREIFCTYWQAYAAR